jgi:mycothiol synthase
MLKWSAVTVDEVLRVKILLKIRPFVKAKDEEAYMRIYNSAFADYDDVRNVTLDEVAVIENAPSQNLDGLLMAEWDGKLAGMVQPYVDKFREEKKGFISSLAVLPEFRRLGIAKRLMSAAIKALREKGMGTIQAWAWTDRVGCVRLYESFGFRLVRVTSLMKAGLDGIFSKADENRDVVLREMATTDDDIALMVRLDNEAFSEHFNFRPVTVEEIKYMLTEMPWYQHRKVWCALLRDEPAGYVVAGIDEGLNAEKRVRYGWVLDIGVLKPHRRRRVGLTLIQRAMRYLKSMGMDDALLYVDETNPTGAMKLYKRVGFSTFHRNAVYELQLS